jgi:integrase
VFISHNGKRSSRRVGDKAAAESVASKIRAKLQLGEFDLEEKKKRAIPLFKDFAEGFMGTYSPLNHKPSTQGSYRQVIDQHLNPVFGDLALEAITRKHVKDFIAQKHDEGLSSGTIRNLKAYLSCILSEAVDDEIISTHPALRTGKLIKRKDDEAKAIAPFTWEEKDLFERTLKEHFPRYYPFFLTALRTGLRLGELIALQPGDLDFNGGFIEVRRNFAKGHLTSTKSGKTRRVDMSKELSETLRAYLVERKKDTLRHGWKEMPEWLFYNDEGKRLDEGNLRRRVFYKVLEKAGLRHIRIHDLRHTYATLRIGKGDNILDVSKQLGHSSVKITLDVYAHWVPGAKKSEVDGLDSKTEPKKENEAVEVKPSNGDPENACTRMLPPCTQGA